MTLSQPESLFFLFWFFSSSSFHVFFPFFFRVSVLYISLSPGSVSSVTSSLSISFMKSPSEEEAVETASGDRWPLRAKSGEAVGVEKSASEVVDSGLARLMDVGLELDESKAC